VLLSQVLVAGGSNLHFYKLVPALMKEARSIGVTVRLVEEQSLCRYQRVTFKKSQGRLAELWDKYEAKTIMTSDFLFSQFIIKAPAKNKMTNLVT
jgi:hypothetical protein